MGPSLRAIGRCEATPVASNGLWRSNPEAKARTVASGLLRSFAPRNDGEPPLTQFYCTSSQVTVTEVDNVSMPGSIGKAAAAASGIGAGAMASFARGAAG